MAFDPSTFVGPASRALAGTTEADLRAAAGRAYYAVYGTLRERLCVAKGVPVGRLFGGTGRHRDLARPMAMLKPFKSVASLYYGLLTLRESADYRYQVAVDRDTVTDAVESAKWILSQLSDLDDADVATHPLQPLQ